MPAPKTKPGAAEAEQHNDPDHSTFVVLQMDRSHIDTVLGSGRSGHLTAGRPIS
jgi:hypothetical protein